MNKFNQVPVEKLSNAFDLIGKQWMLITAGQMNAFNTMTASWGGIGVLWNKPVCFIFIRPQRYTLEFLEKNEYFTLSFLPEEKREALKICGSTSGRDCDKIAKAGLTPISCGNTLAFDESEKIILCKKLYFGDLSPNGFLSADIAMNYPNHDYHRVYIGEIEQVQVKGN